MYLLRHWNEWLFTVVGQRPQVPFYLNGDFSQFPLTFSDLWNNTKRGNRHNTFTNELQHKAWRDSRIKTAPNRREISWIGVDSYGLVRFWPSSVQTGSPWQHLQHCGSMVTTVAWQPPASRRESPKHPASSPRGFGFCIHDNTPSFPGLASPKAIVSLL